MPYKNPLTQKQRQKEIERSLRGYLLQKHRGMRARSQGGMTANPKYFLGVEVLSKDEFLAWALDNEEYKKLHKEWVNNNYDMAKAPSPDRLDSSKGYTIDNMEWVTTEENNRRAHNKNSANRVKLV